MIWVRAVWWLMVVCVPSWMFAQFDLNAYSITVADGLPSNTIYYVVQDFQGAVWIGHDRGISRFNGRQLRNYSLPNSEAALAGVAPWGGDTVLARTFRGDVVSCDANALTVHPQMKRPQLASPQFAFRNGRRMATQFSEVLEISADFRVSPVKFLPDTTDIQIFNSTLHEDGTLYLYGRLGEPVGLFALNLEDLSVQQVVPCTEAGRGLFFDWRGSLHFFRERDRDVFKIAGNKAEKVLSLGLDLGINVNQVHALNDSLLAAGTYSGIHFFDPSGRPEGVFFRDFSISWIDSDKEGNLWVGTLEDGLMVVPALGLRKLDMAGFGRHAKISTHAFIGNDTLLLGTFDGRILWLDGSGKLIRSTLLSNRAEIQTIHVDAENHSLWAFCAEAFQIDLKSGRILDSVQVTSTKAFQTVGDTLYCGTSRGMYRHIGKKQQTYLYDEWIVDLELDDLGDLLVLGRTGTYRLDLDDPSAMPQPVKLPLPEGVVFSQAIADRDGSLFLLAPRAGIFRLKRGAFEKVADLNSKELSGISRLAVHQGKIFAAANDKVGVYDGNWLWYDQTKGILENDLRGLAFKGGRLHVFSPRSVLRIDHFPPKNSVRPQLFLRQARGSYGFESGRWASGHSANFMHLGLEILPNVSSRGQAKVLFNLQGQDSLWVEAAEEDGLFWIRLDRLDPGGYTLHVRAENEDGISSETWKLGMTIAPPVYATWWFWILAATVLALAVYGVIRWSVQRVERKNQAKIAQEKLKIQVLTSELKAIRSQMNPHFIFNTLSAIQAKVLSQDGEAAFDDLATFSKLLRSVLDCSSREYLSLEEELGFLETYLKLEANRFGSRFHWEVVVDEELRGISIRVPTLITQPFVENALRHGLLHKDGEKILKISCSGSPENLLFVISDNGVGRKRSAEINADRPKSHRSFATQATEQRIAYLTQSGGPKVSLEILDLEQGTEVQIRIQDE